MDSPIRDFSTRLRLIFRKTSPMWSKFINNVLNIIEAAKRFIMPTNKFSNLEIYSGNGLVILHVF